ncbi:hypothetical protein CUS80_00330 [Enterococcus faecium]|uniref:hypothetical protein n=1 Tax=Enterococcus faecium TaxID=1352 RepID=UPI000CF3226B|nr:hypothetical protein [Enterococcus faecium]PQG48419.1 hypothetical protein CUS80_00330 [Enterococcus faecium]
MFEKYEVRRTKTKQGYPWAIVGKSSLVKGEILFFKNRLNALEVLKVLESDRRGVRYGWGESY